MLKRIKDLGEEQISKLANQLLESDAFVEGLQRVFATAVRTGEGFQATARFALSSMNLPTLSDFERLGQKVAELEELVDALEGKLELAECTHPKA